ncbi:hypothetical protein UFOVP837_27 [uncultured Caudovirales phage]|jgi:hypothetical protein|uniref:Uncharacterized protein n=1 Tax=uncultured Caudovirales phage TaxID=2100421 RepID=A0A6J5P3R5_9CAUD|nr:hypothetical protein UFOVP837_27 [uncultured Caudovirales phage]
MSRKVSAVTTKTTTTKDTILTVPTKNTGLWQLMYIISLTGNDTPKVYWYDVSTNTEYFIVGGKNLGAGDFVRLDGEAEVVLQAGDQIRVQNSSTNTVTYIATVEFIPETAVQFQF